MKKDKRIPKSSSIKKIPIDWTTMTVRECPMCQGQFWWGCLVDHISHEDKYGKDKD